eukprot:2284176-Pleurochrysis_carterae.AAC.2
MGFGALSRPTASSACQRSWRHGCSGRSATSTRSSRTRRLWRAGRSDARGDSSPAAYLEARRNSRCDIPSGIYRRLHGRGADGHRHPAERGGGGHDRPPAHPGGRRRASTADGEGA